MKPIPYGCQQITESDIEAVIQVLKSDYLTQGPKINEFEEAFASYVGSKYAVAVSNGTAALHLSVMTLGVQEGDKVITTPITFAASANCIRYAGGEVIFADIDQDTYLLDIYKVRELLETQPKGTFKGIIPVDFAGYPVNLEEYKKLCDEFGLFLIEDACHAPGGAFINNQGIRQYCGNGKYADVSIFSFHPVKHIATGEGGMITTNDENIFRKLSMLRTHGITKDPSILIENHGRWYYEMHELGYNYRITDFQAALGISQLPKAQERIGRRQDIAKKYTESFKGTSIITPKVSDDIIHAYHLYVIQVRDRTGLYNYLRKHSIFTQVHYIPVHKMPYYAKLGWKKGDFPIAEEYYLHCLSLPMYPTLTQDQQDYVIDKILKFVNE